MNTKAWCLLGTVLLSAPAFGAGTSHPFQHGAGAPAARTAGADAPVGSQTRAWLQLQRSGAQASPVERPQPGEIAERSYQRYLKSYEQPIPAEFDRDQFIGGSGSR